MAFLAESFESYVSQTLVSWSYRIVT